MECGSQDFICQIANWLSENDLASAGLVEFLGKIGEGASGIRGTLAQFLREYGQALVGLLGIYFWRLALVAIPRTDFPIKDWPSISATATRV